MLQEFREFAVKGNVMDMAVGIIIGAAFTTIVQSFVADIINPILGIFTGGLDFSALFLNISGEEVGTLAEAQERGLAVISYGVFLNAVISFLIVAWVLFLLVRGINRLKREAEPTSDEPATEDTPEPAADVQLLTEIRDMMQARGGAM